VDGKILKFSILAIATLTFIGCGGGGGKGVDSTVSNTAGTGYYNDSPVEGLTCVSGSTTSVTDKNGTFRYEEGKDTICKVGDIALPTIPAGTLSDDVKYYQLPLSEADAGMFLQSLDSDGDPSNGITIEKDTIEALKANKIKQIPNSDNGIKTLLIKVKDYYNKKGKTTKIHQVTKTQAIKHLREQATKIAEKNGVLKKQDFGTMSYLFYGNVNQKGLSSLKNVKVIGADEVNKTIISVNSIDDRYPVLNTSLSIGSDGNYSDLHVDGVYFTSSKIPYKISLLKSNIPTQIKNSNVTDVKSISRQKINYLGSKEYSIATKNDGTTVLIAPDMNPTDSPKDFTHKTLLGVTYKKYGNPVDGYLVINDSDDNKSTPNQLQKCDLNVANCKDISSVGSKTVVRYGRSRTSYDLTILGDIPGTSKSIILSNNKIYELDKATGTQTEKTAVPANGSSYTLSGNDIFYIDGDGNIHNLSLDGNDIQISSDGKGKAGFKAFTDDMVIYGNDDYMYAVMKDGSSKKPIEISVSTNLKGQKYPYSLGVGKQYLYTLWSMDEKTGKNTFIACKLESGKKECRKNSYWVAITAAKNGKINNSSSYFYTPYSYIRVDDPDNYGGGVVKAVNPKKPLKGGLPLGKFEKYYNFQTFFLNFRYNNELVDSNGSIVLYAKNDINYKCDAFYANLNEVGSLQNITNEPIPKISDVNGNNLHCHGRMCSVCHSFAGGKIYSDPMRKGSSIGNTIKFDFKDGTSMLATAIKGKGEDFNIPVKYLVGKKFTATVVDENNDTNGAQSNPFSHNGVANFNCDYCHGSRGNKEGAKTIWGFTKK